MFNLYNFIICNKSHYCSWDNETDKVRCDKGETINVHLTWVPPEESHLSGNEKTSQMPEGTVDTIDERMSADEIVTRLVAFHNWPCITQWHSITDPAYTMAFHNGIPLLTLHYTVAFHNWPCITQWHSITDPQWHSITDPALHNGIP